MSRLVGISAAAKARRRMEMSGIAQGISHAQRGEQLQPEARRRGAPGARAPGRAAGLAGQLSGQGGRDPVPLPTPSCPSRLLQLQHHLAGPPSCPPAPQLPPAPLVLAPCDGALLVSGLQKELGLGPGPLLPAHLLHAGGSPVASAAQLLDTHLHISRAPAPHPAATLPPGFVATGLPPADCEMEDLTAGPRGTFVLVQ